MINHLSKIASLLFLLLLIFSTLTCKKSPIEPETSGVVLSLEDVTCTEMWGKLRYYEISPPVEANIYLNDKKIKSYTLTTNDTIIYIDSLLPKRQYNLYIELTDDKRTRKSNILKFETMDTTSRNFTWQVFEFGECSNSVLFDVAIIDENDIWAVGEIYMRDSLGRCDPNSYNAVHWDGQKWELIRINGHGGWARRSIMAFSKNNIWFDGGIHWDGKRYTVFLNGWPLMPNGDGWQVNKMWGTSSSDLYAVGDKGNIAHWDGVRWRKIELSNEWGSGPKETDLIDISGSRTTGRIFVNGYNTINMARSVLAEIKNNVAEVLWYSDRLIYVHPYGTTITNVYSPDNYLFVASTKGFFVENIKLKTSPKKVTNIALDWVYGMRGNSYNDVFTFADDSEIYHFNGVNLRKLFSDYYTYNTLFGGNVKGNIVVGVGTRMIDVVYYKARIVIGRRR